MEHVSEQDTQRIEEPSDDLHLHTERAATLTRLAILEHKAGRIAEAERLLVEAIEVGDEHLGENHPSQATALNELSRLLVRHGEHARAEPVLERLLTLARHKGERHPDVATALAGLAVAKRGLGDDAAAERLYRQALDIREEVLPPNHMAIVITMEQLAETCVARDDLAEALALLQRALPRRECALGAEHPTVIAGHDRKVELARRMFEARLVDLRQTQVPFTGAVVPLGAALMEPVSNAPTPIASPEIEVASASSPELAAPEETPRLSRRTRRKARFAAASGVILAALMAIAGFTLGTRNRTVSGVAPSVTSSQERLALVSSAPSASSPAWVRASGARAGLPAASSTASASSAAERTPALPSVRRLVMPRVALPNPDSVAQISAKVARDAELVSAGLGATLSAAPRAEEPSVVPPMLIGTAPTPRFPDELRSQKVEGEVVVRFKVDEQGRVDQSSMQVVRSAHELFTAAVRASLPRLRFAPAHSTARDAKPEAAWVQLSTQFAVKH